MMGIKGRRGLRVGMLNSEHVFLMRGSVQDRLPHLQLMDYSTKTSRTSQLENDSSDSISPEFQMTKTYPSHGWPCSLATVLRDKRHRSWLVTNGIRLRARRVRAWRRAFGEALAMDSTARTNSNRDSSPRDAIHCWILSSSYRSLSLTPSCFNQRLLVPHANTTHCISLENTSQSFSRSIP